MFQFLQQHWTSLFVVRVNNIIRCVSFSHNINLEFLNILLLKNGAENDVKVMKHTVEVECRVRVSKLFINKIHNNNSTIYYANFITVFLQLVIHIHH